MFSWIENSKGLPHLPRLIYICKDKAWISDSDDWWTPTENLIEASHDLPEIKDLAQTEKQIAKSLSRPE